ncbi:MAG: metallophosphoesterase family protein [Solirubrobacteraceae bacterium]|nr:metallophosphoesterase family protein [Solirubrobacteraceae bacterium]
MLGLLYDVHGNVRALEAVLADARTRGVTSFLIGGDVALFGPHPVAAVEALRALPSAVWIRGNGERWTAAPSEAPDALPVPQAITAARAALGDELVSELTVLPESAPIGDRARAWHGSPVGDLRSFLPTPAPDEAELLEGVTEARLVFGHTHLPFRRISAHGGIELINPGSVGMPFDGDVRAAYATIAPDGTVTHHRVTYDHTEPATDLRAAYPGADWADLVARRIEQARVDPEPA